MYLLVKNRYTTQRTASPLGKVGVELGVECLYEGSHEGNLERWASDGAFPPEIHALVVCYEGGQDGQNYLDVGASREPTRQEAILFK